MFQEFSPLQMKQLQNQDCPQTNRVRLAIYVPSRHPRLTHSLVGQLHRNFFVTENIADLRDPHLAGAILIAEDVSCTITALSYFAQALLDGNDYVYCDEVYGLNGDIGCFFPEGTAKLASLHAAAVSGDLIREVLGQLDSEEPEILLGKAFTMAHSPFHISQALLRYLRMPRANDIYTPGAKRAMVFSHYFNLTGSPVVLCEAIPFLIDQGYEVVVVGPEYDSLLPMFTKAGAIALTDPKVWHPSPVTTMAFSCDLVFVNSLVEAEIVSMLNGYPVPVVWWIHEAEETYLFMAPNLPHTQGSNITVRCVSKLTQRLFQRFCPDFVSEIMPYALKDKFGSETEYFPLEHHREFLFTTIGTISETKGQDILCQAIRLLPPQVRERCSFLLVGKKFTPSIMRNVKDLRKDFPDQIQYLERVPRHLIDSIDQQTDCIICSSRCDSLPTFVAEGWMHGTPCICSENTGTTPLIQDGVNSLVYHNNDPQELADKILEFVSLSDEKRKSMGQACRQTYLDYFTPSALEPRLAQAVQEATEKAAK